MTERLIPGFGYVQETGAGLRLIPGLGYVQETVSGGTDHALTAESIVTGAPVLGFPALTLSGEFAVDGITAGAPVLGSPALTQDHKLTATAIASGIPLLGTPVLSRYGLSGLTTTNVTASGARHSLTVTLP